MIKQVKFKDLTDDPQKEHLGILLENGDVVCACCGGIQEADDRGETWEIVAENDEWQEMGITSEKPATADKTIRVFLWDGLIDMVQSSEEKDHTSVEIYNCDPDHDDKEKYEEIIKDPNMHDLCYSSCAHECAYDDE